MKVVVVGCGYISRVHLAAMKFTQGVEPVAVVDTNRERARERAVEFRVPRVYDDWKDAIASEQFDAALVCLPHKLHYPCVMDCLAAGKHVLLEKPISIASSEAEAMCTLAREKGLTFMVAYMKRFDRRFSLMKEKIESGSIGRVFMAKSEWIGPKEIFVLNPWTADASQGGGPLMGFGSHHVDLLQWMAGPIEDVYCNTARITCPAIEVEDTAVAVLRFANGAVGSLIYSWGAAIHGQYECLTVDGTGGSLKLENDTLVHVSEAEYGDRTPRKLDTAMSEMKDIEEFGSELAIASLEPFVLEMRHFAQCLQTGTRSMIDGDEAKKSLDVIIKAYKIGGRL